MRDQLCRWVVVGSADMENINDFGLNANTVDEFYSTTGSVITSETSSSLS